MIEFIGRFFRREEASKDLAKERLRLVLMSDRVSLAPDVFHTMKSEMLDVIRRYLDVDEKSLDMHFENLERQFILLANIPVLNVKMLDQKTGRRETPPGVMSNAAPKNGVLQGVGDPPIGQSTAAMQSAIAERQIAQGLTENCAGALDPQHDVGDDLTGQPPEHSVRPKRRRRRKKAPHNGSMSAPSSTPDAAAEDSPPTA